MPPDLDRNPVPGPNLILLALGARFFGAFDLLGTRGLDATSRDGKTQNGDGLDVLHISRHVHKFWGTKQPVFGQCETVLLFRVGVGYMIRHRQ